MALPFDPFPTPPSKGTGSYTAAWTPVQTQIAARVVVAPLRPMPRFIAAADCAFSRTTVYAVALIWDRERQTVVDLATQTRPLNVPYISGFLSFREGPAILAAIAKLHHPFQVITFDGQGLAHPRRCGLATHLGVALDVPSIGVAKSRLVGVHADVPDAAGSSSALTHRDETIGIVLRTRDRVRPVYVSIGHRVDLPSAVELVQACVTRYRIPEPTRLADREVAKLKLACV